MSSTVNNGAASVPSPPDAANGFPQPGVSSGAWPRAEEELRAAEPGLVKRAHREILDHERKRRVELKCMELQEMMELLRKRGDMSKVLKRSQLEEVSTSQIWDNVGTK